MEDKKGYICFVHNFRNPEKTRRYEVWAKDLYDAKCNILKRFSIKDVGKVRCYLAEKDGKEIEHDGAEV